MRRNLAQPLDARVFHRRIGVEALGDGPADEGGALLLEQFDQSLLLCNEGVDLRRLPIEEGGNGTLFGEGW